MSAESGAPPETKKRSRPPTRAASLVNTSWYAARYLSPSPAGIGLPSIASSAQASPTRLAQRKIFCLSGEPAIAFSSTRA